MCRRASCAALALLCAVPAARCFGPFAGSREVRELRRQLDEATARVEAQAGHIEALYALAGHAVTLERAGAPAARAFGGQAGAATPHVGTADTFASDLLSRARARALDKLEVRWVIDVGARVTALAFMAAFTDGGSPRFVFAADEQRVLHAFGRGGERLMAHQTEHAGPITAMAFGSREDPFVATASTDGTVHISNLTLSRGASVASAAGSAKPSASAQFRLGAPLTVALRPDADGGARAEETAEETAEVTALDVYVSSRRALILAADSAGAIRAIGRDGAVGRPVHVGGAEHNAPDGASPEPVVALRRAGSLVAYATTSSIGLLDLHRMSVVRVCQPLPPLPVARGAAAPPRRAFVSLAFDLHAPQLLYASTTDGAVHVYNTRARRPTPAGAGAGGKGDGAPLVVCKLAGSFHSPHALSLIHI